MTDAESWSSWRNEVVPIGELPAVDDAPFEAVERRYLLQQRVTWAIGLGGLAVAASVFLLLLDAPSWLVIALLAAIAAWCALAWILAGLAFAHRGVQLREHDVSSRRGLVGRRTISVPFTRVQHVTVERGVVDRVFGLASVVIYTAGAIAADARVSGLTPERADQLREGIINRSTAVQDRFGHDEAE